VRANDELLLIQLQFERRSQISPPATIYVANHYFEHDYLIAFRVAALRFPQSSRRRASICRNSSKTIGQRSREIVIKSTWVLIPTPIVKWNQ
jgi:hypothetical protein